MESAAVSTAARPGLRSVLAPVLVSLVAGLVAVGVLVSAFSGLRPHEVPIAVVANQATVDQLSKTAATAFDFRAVPNPATAKSQLESREVYGVIVVTDGALQVQYAAANGPVLNNQITASLRPAGAEYSVVDLVPAASGDESGFSVFFLVVGVVIGALALGLTLALAPARLRRRNEILTLIGGSVLLGVLSVVIAGPVLDVIDSGVAVVMLVQTFLAFAVASIAWALGRAHRLVGPLLAVLLVAVVSVALSGALLPPPYLEGVWATVGALLPAGLAAQATMGAAYFDNDAVDLGLGVLLLWALVALVAATLLDRVRGTVVAAPTAADRRPAAKKGTAKKGTAKKGAAKKGAVAKDADADADADTGADTGAATATDADDNADENADDVAEDEDGSRPASR